MTPGAGPPLSPGAAGFRGVLCLPGPQTPGASPVSCVAGRGGGGYAAGRASSISRAMGPGSPLVLGVCRACCFLSRNPGDQRGLGVLCLGGHSPCWRRDTCLGVQMPGLGLRVLGEDSETHFRSCETPPGTQELLHDATLVS